MTGSLFQQSRAHHYQFAHRFLPKLLEENARALVDNLSRDSAIEYLKAHWWRVGVSTSSTESGIEFVDVEGLSIVVREVSNVAKIIGVRFPPPERMAEAFYAAIIFRQEDQSYRYYTLELTGSYLGTERSVIRGEWSNGSHFNYGPHPHTDLEGFVESVARLETSRSRDLAPLLVESAPENDLIDEEYSAEGFEDEPEAPEEIVNAVKALSRKSVSETQLRSIRFPDDRSVGHLYLCLEPDFKSFQDSLPDWAYPEVAFRGNFWRDAQSVVEVPVGSRVGLVCQSFDFEALAQLRPGDLQEIEFDHFDGNQDYVNESMKYVQRLTGLRAISCRMSGITDFGLAHFQFLKSLQMLNLEISYVTGFGLKYLRSLTNLTLLDLSFSDIENAGLEHVEQLKSLQFLNLDETSIDDVGLHHLRGLSSMKALILPSTVSRSGRMWLSRQLPQCQIYPDPAR